MLQIWKKNREAASGKLKILLFHKTCHRLYSDTSIICRRHRRTIQLTFVSVVIEGDNTGSKCDASSDMVLHSDLSTSRCHLVAGRATLRARALQNALGTRNGARPFPRAVGPNLTLRGSNIYLIIVEISLFQPFDHRAIPVIQSVRLIVQMIDQDIAHFISLQIEHNMRCKVLYMIALQDVASADLFR